MPEQRNVAGLSCGDVLARLSDYVDRDQPEAERRRVEDHLRGCDWCEKFGGEFTMLVTALRSELAGAPSLGLATENRLKLRLAAAVRD